jgi:hypothetical protein
VNLLDIWLRSLLLTESEDTILVSSDICDLNISEASCETFKDLHLTLLSVVKLHPGIDVLLVRRVKADKVAPFLT